MFYLEQAQKVEMKLSILNGSFLNDSFQESIKPSSFISDVQSIAERSKLSFDQIQFYTKSAEKDQTKESYQIMNSDSTESSFALKQDLITKDYLEFKVLQKDLNKKRSELEREFKEKRTKLRMSLNTLSREKQKIVQVENKTGQYLSEKV